MLFVMVNIVNLTDLELPRSRTPGTYVREFLDRLTGVGRPNLKAVPLHEL